MSASYRYGAATGRRRIGEHRMSRREARWLRVELRHEWPATARAALLWAELVDWVLLPLRRSTPGPAVLPPVCETCRQNRHRECGLFLEDPPCGCSCPAAGKTRKGGAW